MRSTILRGLAAVAIAASAVVLTSGCTSLYGVLPDTQSSPDAKSTPTPPPAPQGTLANPYGASSDPYASGYIGDWVALPNGKRVLCVRWGGSENGSDPISCDFEHEIDPPAPAK